MAADDRNEKSLFFRIMDCELERSKNEVTRAKCSSRSMWVWNLERNVEPDEKTESQKDKLPSREIAKSLKDKDGQSTNENNETRLRGGHEHEHKGTHENVDQCQKKVETNSEAKEHQQCTRPAEKKHEKHDQHKQNVDQQKSCESSKFKPVQYYIKMQDPEAPPCCATRKSRKICPPKTRKYQQEDRAPCPSRPTCRCEGCVAEFHGNRFS